MVLQNGIPQFGKFHSAIILSISHEINYISNIFVVFQIRWWLHRDSPCRRSDARFRTCPEFHGNDILGKCIKSKCNRQMIYTSAVYYLRWKYLDIEQLLNKAGHDIKNYQEWGLCSPKPSAEVNNANRSLIISISCENRIQ
jgi:hypothetical protein